MKKTLKCFHQSYFFRHSSLKYILLFVFFVVTANQTKWDQHDNTTRLDDRINDITNWRISLERCIRATETEIEVSRDFLLNCIIN